MRRILSIDGGGIMGVQPAAFLAAIEEDLDRPLIDHFDLIAGTSTGGIIAIGLAMGLSAKEILALYEKRGPHIFGQSAPKGRIGGWIRKKRQRIQHLIRPKHEANVLRAELEKVLSNRLLGEARTRLVVPAWDADHRGVYVVKTSHHPKLRTDYRKPAIDAAMATASAPTYFKRHRTVDDVGLLDGGVWANNPVAVAVVEAISILGWAPTELRILSLGCVDEVYLIDEAPGAVGLGFNALRLFSDGQSRGAHNMARLLTGDSDANRTVYRYAPTAPADFFSLDDTSKIHRLKGMGASAARGARPALDPVFFAEPTEPFHPAHCLKELAA